MDDGKREGGSGQDGNGNGKIISFPGGKKVSTDEVGVPYVVAGSGSVPTIEPPDVKIIADEDRERAAYVRRQTLVKALEDGASTSELIDAVLKDMAEESAHLKWERRTASKDGKPTANYNVARVNALRSIAELLIKRKEASIAERLDLKSPRFQKIFKLILGFFADSMMKSGVEQEIMDLVFQQMKADMRDWEKLVDASD